MDDAVSFLAAPLETLIRAKANEKGQGWRQRQGSRGSRLGQEERDGSGRSEGRGQNHGYVSVAGGGSRFGKGSLIVCQVGELGEC